MTLGKSPNVSGGLVVIFASHSLPDTMFNSWQNQFCSYLCLYIVRVTSELTLPVGHWIAFPLQLQFHFQLLNDSSHWWPRLSLLVPHRLLSICCLRRMKELNKNVLLALAGVSHWIEWVPACEPKGCRFNSQSGHMPELWARSPVGGVQEATYRCFSPSFSLPSPLSKNK